MSSVTCSDCGAPMAESQARRFGGVCPDCALKFAAREELPEFPGLEITATLGKGGMGIVYEAVQARVERTVALKVLSPHLAFNAGFMKRFHAEGRALARLLHPNIVTLFDMGVHGGLPYLVLEKVDGTSLRAMLKAGKVPLPRALEIVDAVLDALECAHEAGIVHRDVKPENILIGPRGRVKLVDFGLAWCVQAEGASSSKAKFRVGTPLYMAPEQRRRPEDVDGRADLYSLGVVLLELLGGRPPKRPGGEFSLGRTLPMAFASFLKRMLAADPEQRIASAAAARSTLASLRSRIQRVPP